MVRKTGLFVPAYFGPWETTSWRCLLALRPATVVVNPASGPGAFPVDGYLRLVDEMLSVGIEVLGYVSSRWLTRTTDEVAAEVDTYARWYDVRGVFLDEIPNVSAPGRVSRIASMADLVGPANTVANCGQPVPTAWFTRLPGLRIGTFEGTAELLAQTPLTGPPSRQVHFVHSVPAEERPSVATAVLERGVGGACITSDVMPNPWDVCPGPLTDCRPGLSHDRAYGGDRG
jgi:hypothetical protein